MSKYLYDKNEKDNKANLPASEASETGLPDGSMWNHFRQKWCWKKHVVLVVPKWFHRIFAQILMFVVNNITLIGIFIHESQFICDVLTVPM